MYYDRITFVRQSTRDCFTYPRCRAGDESNRALELCWHTKSYLFGCNLRSTLGAFFYESRHSAHHQPTLAAAPARNYGWTMTGQTRAVAARPTVLLFHRQMPKVLRCRDFPLRAAFAELALHRCT